jgi:hypothetical protein
MQPFRNAPGANKRSICDCLSAPRPKDSMLDSIHDHRQPRTCSGLRRAKRAMYRKRVTKHLCCGPRQSGTQATLLLCFEHNFVPSRLKSWTIGPPSVNDAMAPTPCFLPLAAVVCPPSMFHCLPCRCALRIRKACVAVSDLITISLTCLLLVGR